MNHFHYSANATSRGISTLLLLGSFAFAGCGSGHDVAGTGGTGGSGGAPGTGGGTDAAVDAGLLPITLPPCVSGENTACLPSGFPFATFAFAHSYACNGICFAASPAGAWTILLSQPVASTLCLSGTNPDPGGTGLALDFTSLAVLGPTPDRLMVIKRFNADLPGITQVRFVVDNPPSGGITVSAYTLHSDVCNGVDCITFGFALPNRVTASGTTTASLGDFVSNPPKTFETRAIDAISFDVGPGDFNFCVHDFHFLNAAGVEVLPPETDADAGAGNGAVDGGQG